MHDADLLLVDRARVLEGEAQNPLGSLPGDKLDALNDTVDDHVLNARVFTLSVLTDQHSVDVVVGGLVASNRSAGAQVGEKVESTTQGKVQRDVSLSNGGLNAFLAMRFG